MCDFCSVIIELFGVRRLTFRSLFSARVCGSRCAVRCVERFSAPRDMSESLAPPASLADASTWLSEQKSWRNATVKQYHLENAAQAAAYTRDNTNRVSFSAPQVRSFCWSKPETCALHHMTNAVGGREHCICIVLYFV